MTGDGSPWQTPSWALPKPPARADGISWGKEIRTAVLVSAFLTLLGSIVGIAWHALAPEIGIVDATNGSTAAMKALIGDDAWLGGLGLVAGVLSVLVLIVVARDDAEGPGATIGLAVGGFLGMLVAARVGHLIGHRELADAVKGGFPGVTPKGVKIVLSYFDFSVRAKGVLFSWPLAAVLLNGVIVFIRSLNEPPPQRLSTYPGSS
jgi:hypothetical protein